MYTQKHNREDDREKLCAFMREYSFATLVTAADGLPRATHLPFLIESDDDSVRLQAHMARANDQWRDFALVNGALVIFQEPHAYISPRHYERPLSVPTWNYVAVHASGPARIFETRDEKSALLERLIRHHDERFLDDWRAYPEDFKTHKLEGIVAFEISVTRLEGRFKLSQDRTLVEQENIARELGSSRNPVISKIAQMMRRNLGSKSRD